MDFLFEKKALFLIEFVMGKLWKWKLNLTKKKKNPNIYLFHEILKYGIFDL
jgi:hypothetical protein